MKKIFLLLLSCIPLIGCGCDRGVDEGRDAETAERRLYSFSQGSAGFYYNLTFTFLLRRSQHRSLFF
jgi:hypothetical protein